MAIVVSSLSGMCCAARVHTDTGQLTELESSAERVNRSFAHHQLLLAPPPPELPPPQLPPPDELLLPEEPEPPPDEPLLFSSLAI